MARHQKHPPRAPVQRRDEAIPCPRRVDGEKVVQLPRVVHAAGRGVHRNHVMQKLETAPRADIDTEVHQSNERMTQAIRESLGNTLQTTTRTRTSPPSTVFMCTPTRMPWYQNWCTVMVCMTVHAVSPAA
jgi:hypothetical protein